MNKPNAENSEKRLMNGSSQPVGVVQDGIALRLRELYSNLENEGIPDNLLHLLERLDEAERAHAGKQTPGI